MRTPYPSKRILLIVCALMLVLATQGIMAQAPSVCPLSQGYWANHSENWPVTGLMLGAQFYTQSELLAFLPGGGGDASTMLAVQLIAAKLNIAAGAAPESISAALVQADTLLSTSAGKLPYNIEPSSSTGQSMVNVAAALDAFNNGQVTPNCAPTATVTPTSTPIRPSTVIVIQGPVQAVNVNIITIAGLNIQVSANDPILASIQVGTLLRVEGTIITDAAGNTLIAASIVTPAPADTASVVFYIQGTVDAVNGSTVIIAGIPVQIDPANPVFASLQPGDVVEINAVINLDGATVVIVATTIVIVINSVPDATPTFTPTTTPPTLTPAGTLTPPATTPTPAANLPVTIIVEGPVQTINVNIITIYDIDIQIDAGDPVLTQIQIGDFVRVEGDILTGVDTVVVVAVTVFVVDIDIIVGNDNTIIWEDRDDCSNPPPPWAPAHGWRRRCENADFNPGGNGNNGNHGNNGNNGRGNNGNNGNNGNGRGNGN